MSKEERTVTASGFFIDNDLFRKKQMRNILSSYNNYWDILAELLQNSVDGIIRKGSETGNITIKIDSRNKTINVKDDGCGINPDDLEKFLNPNYSDKEDRSEEGGEKGVGLSFVIFQCNDFSIKTHLMNQKFTKTAYIKNAYTWCTNDDDDSFVESDKKESTKFEGTEITVKKNRDSTEKIFDLSLNQLIYILRTKTAIGCVDDIFNNQKTDIKVKLVFIDKTNKKTEKNIDYSYFLPTEHRKNLISMDEAINIKNDNGYSDEDKIDFLSNKIIYDSDTYEHDGVVYKYWACHLYSRHDWDDINKSNKLLNVDDEKTPRFKAGATLSTKGMPTAIELPLPTNVGESGRLSNIFVLINDDVYVPDIGRKAVTNDNQKIYTNIYKKFYSKIISIKEYLKQEQVEEEKPFDISVIKEEIKNAPKFKSSIIKYKCVPYNQEAGVVAIFHELIGTKKAFINFTPYDARYRNKYDLYGYYNNQLVSIEFKCRLRNLLNDFKNKRKVLNEIDYIVCYDVDDEEIELFNKININIEKVDMNTKSKKYMPETTHRIKYNDYANPIYIIDLKVLLSELEKQPNLFINK